MTKTQIYDALCETLTNYESGTYDANDLYELLVEIQNNWESVITAEEG